MMSNLAQNTIANLLQAKREEIILIAAKHGAFNVRVFGSVARNEADTESDIDVLISFTPDNCWTLFDRVDMRDELTEIFGRKVDLVNKRGTERSRNYLRKNDILNSTKVIYEITDS